MSYKIDQHAYPSKYHILSHMKIADYREKDFSQPHDGRKIGQTLKTLPVALNTGIMLLLSITHGDMEVKSEVKFLNPRVKIC